MAIKMITLVCDGCGKTFERTMKDHNRSIRNGAKSVACSRQCWGVVKYGGTITLVCSNEVCAKRFERKKSNHEKNLRLGFHRTFCSIACRHAWRRGRIDPWDSYGLITLQDLRSQYSQRDYHAKLRGYARSAYKHSGLPYECFNCGYTLHVDICHVIGIKNFSMDTPLSTVNHIDNLVALDKRCHWEFDHGHITLKGMK